MQIVSSSYETISFTKLPTRQHTHKGLDTSGKGWPCTHEGTAEERGTPHYWEEERDSVTHCLMDKD